jgi:hypothetical protein
MNTKRFRLLLSLPLLFTVLLITSTGGRARPTNLNKMDIRERQFKRTAFLPPGFSQVDSPVRAQAAGASESFPPTYQWHTFYGPGPAPIEGDIAFADDGSVYITGPSGCWLGDADAPPLHPCSGDYADIVVIKLDSHGAYQWHTYYGGDEEDGSLGIAIADDGSVYIAGSSMYSWVGDGGAAPLHPHSEYGDLVVVKLDSTGTYQWHTFYGSSDSDSGRGIAIDGDGNVYITGRSQASWTGDGDAMPLHPHSGGYDITALKLDSQGAYQWHTFYGSSDSDDSRGIAVDNDGGVYISGHGYASWLGDAAAAPLHPYSGNLDIITLKLDSQGAYQWHTFHGSGDFDLGGRLAVLQDGRVYVTGLSSVSWKGDGGIESLHAHSGFTDIFAMKLDSQGAYQWHTFYGSAGRDSGIDIAVASDGRAFLSGYSYTSWLGDDGAVPLHAHSEYGDDIMLMSLDSNGAYQWHTFYGAAGSYYGTYSDSGLGIAFAEDGSLYTMGYSYATWLGDNGAEPLHPHSGFFDITVLKLQDESVIEDIWLFLPLILR